MKFTKLALAAMMAASLAACGSTTTATEPEATAASEETATEEVVTTGTYTFHNGTRKAINEIYLYEQGSEDKGENLLAAPLENKGDTTVIGIAVDPEEAEGYAMTVEYVDADGNAVVVFDGLHLEEADMILLSATDIESGATPFVQHGKYTFTNATGATVAELYLYQAGSDDKGENLAGEGLEDGASVEDVTVDVMAADAASYEMIVEYVLEDGTSAVVFDTLHLEEATLTLKPAADIESGATPFSAE